MNVSRQDKIPGFTIVELLIVVVVIAILATITAIAYTNFQERARVSAADSSLAQITKKLALYKAEYETYPSNLSSIGVQNEGNVTFDYSSAGAGFCLSATVATITRLVSAALQTPGSGSCEVAPSKWTYSGGTTYDGTKDQIQLNPSLSGVARSPLVANNGRTSARISVEVYATQPAPNYTPDSNVHFSSYYYGSDKVSSATNTTGHTSNGNVSCRITMSTWTTCSWTTPTGPGVQWVGFSINSSPNNYTSNNIYRNIQITTLN